MRSATMRSVVPRKHLFQNPVNRVAGQCLPQVSEYIETGSFIGFVTHDERRKTRCRQSKISKPNICRVSI